METNEFTPRRGDVLVVLIIVRISTLHQDRKSLDDQAEKCKQYILSRYRGEVRFTIIQGQGSGEILDRVEFLQAVEAAESGQYDVIITEDLGRICRRTQGTIFCETCEDSRTRLIAINDAVDTSREDWRLGAFFASVKHEMANRDTSLRIRRSLRNRFQQGGIVQCTVFGYIKPPGTTSDDQLEKDPAAQPIYNEIFRRLEDGASYWEIADWLNDQCVPVGPYIRAKRWDGRILARLVHNPIIKGIRRRNERVSVRVNKTGRRKTVKAPRAERLERNCPYLAFIEPDRYDRVIALLKQRNAGWARHSPRGVDCRDGVSKKHTTWPGQHIVCGVCGRPFYWGGHGVASHMMCAGAREYVCWNVATFDGHEAARRLTAAVLAEIEKLPDFDAVFRERVQKHLHARTNARTSEQQQLSRELAQTERALGNLVETVERMGSSPTLEKRIQELEIRKATLTARVTELKKEDVPLLSLPSADELRVKALQVIGRLAFDDQEYGRTLRRILPSVVVLPYRPLDGSHLVLRAHVTIDLAPLMGDHGALLVGPFQRQIVVDLFDSPEHVRLRESIMNLRSTGLTERQAAAKVGISVTLCQRAAVLHRMMQLGGTTDPYQLVTAPPDGKQKFKRHRHPRYQFTPLKGFPIWMQSGVDDAA